MSGFSFDRSRIYMTMPLREIRSLQVAKALAELSSLCEGFSI